MATKIPADEKLDRQDLDLFEALSALDRKDYSYFDKLSEEQQRKFSSYMMTHWMSQVKANGGIQGYYVRSVDHYANEYLFNEVVMKHPKLQWMMLSASSPGIGKQFHQWVPHLSDKIGKLKDKAKSKEVKDYFKKVYPKASDSDLNELTEVFVEQQNRKYHLASIFPAMKLSDIETLNGIITDDDIRNYEEDRGN